MDKNKFSQFCDKSSKLITFEFGYDRVKSARDLLPFISKI
jgi:hypothetical protein